MKRFLVLMVMMLLVLCACGNDEQKEEPADDAGNVNIDTDSGSTDVESTPTEAPTATPTKGPDKVDGPIAGPGPNGGTDKEGTFTKDDLGITIADVLLTPGMDFTPYVDVVGEDPEILEGQACLEGGYDTNYYYGMQDLIVYTYAKDGMQIIYNISVASEAYPNDRGVKVGVTTRDEVIEIYGEPTESLNLIDHYKVDGSTVQMSIVYDGDVVDYIDYIDTAVQ